MQKDNDEASVRAVIHSTSGKKYIGTIADPLTYEKRIENSIPIKLEDAYELHSSLMPVQLPGGSGMKHLVQCLPIDAAQGGSKIRAVAGAIMLFNEMSVDDKKRHIGLLDQIKKQMMEARAAASGISLASALPAGHNGRAS